MLLRELEIVGAVNDRDRLDEAIAALADPALRLADLVTHRFALDDYETAFAWPKPTATAHEGRIHVLPRTATPKELSTDEHHRCGSNRARYRQGLRRPGRASEAHGVRFVSLLKISTDEGITGWSDIETQPHIGHAIVNAPSSGVVGFESLKTALIGEDPLERERLWQKAYRAMAYYGRQGAGMQMLSGADIALWDIAGKAFGATDPHTARRRTTGDR